jgi:hypothetical protein
VTTDVFATEDFFPFADLFPALIEGRESLSDTELAALQDYILNLAVARGFPLHPAVCWNALCWGFDLETRRYVDVPLDCLELVRSGERRDALPVGAFVEVPAGQSANEFWGEVVAKEGRAVDPATDEVEARLSGAPSKPEVIDSREVVALREALIVDFGVVEEPSSHAFERQRTRGNVFDARYHLTVDSLYQGNDADLDDATYFARWAVRKWGIELRRGRFGAALTDEALGDDDMLLAALVASLTTLREVMHLTPGCAMWRDYLFDLESYERRLADRDAALGGSDLERLPVSLSMIHRDQSVGYAALGPRLAEMAKTPEDQLRLTGPQWLTVVCHASSLIVARLDELAPDGVLETKDGPVHLRLDDAWQCGGVWRAERVIDDVNAYCRIPPSIPLGLGYLESTGALHPEAFVEEESALEVTATQIAQHVTLRMSDIDGDRLPLSRRLLGEIGDALLAAGESDIIVRLIVEGIELAAPDRAHHTVVRDTAGEAPSLRGVLWPLPFVAGVRVYAVWQRGATTVDVRLRRRDEPLIVDGVAFEYECDPRILAGHDDIPDQTVTRGRTLRELVLGVFRHRGEETTGGARSATIQRVVWGVYGPSAPAAAVASVRRVLDEMCDEGTLHRDGEVIFWIPGPGRGSHVGDQSLLEEYGLGAVHRVVREYDVSLFLRRLPKSEAVSHERQYEYLEMLDEIGNPPWLPSRLPDGMTFVRPHSRGGFRWHDETET